MYVSAFRCNARFSERTVWGLWYFWVWQTWGISVFFWYLLSEAKGAAGREKFSCMWVFVFELQEAAPTVLVSLFWDEEGVATLQMYTAILLRNEVFVEHRSSRSRSVSAKRGFRLAHLNTNCFAKRCKMNHDCTASNVEQKSRMIRTSVDMGISARVLKKLRRWWWIQGLQRSDWRPKGVFYVPKTNLVHCNSLNYSLEWSSFIQFTLLHW